MKGKDIIEIAVSMLCETDISGYKISNDTGITEATISNYRNKITKPTFANAKMLLDYFEKMEEKKTIGERLLKFLQIGSLERSEFENKVGLTFDGFFNNSQRFTSRHASKICSAYPILNFAWLLTGDGHMLNDIDSLESEFKQDKFYMERYFMDLFYYSIGMLSEFNVLKEKNNLGIETEKMAKGLQDSLNILIDKGNKKLNKYYNDKFEEDVIVVIENWFYALREFEVKESGNSICVIIYNGREKDVFLKNVYFILSNGSSIILKRIDDYKPIANAIDTKDLINKIMNRTTTINPNDFITQYYKIESEQNYQIQAVAVFSTGEECRSEFFDLNRNPNQDGHTE